MRAFDYIKLIIYLTVLLVFLSCSQKKPNIDGKNSKFTHHFYPAKIESNFTGMKTGEHYI